MCLDQIAFDFCAQDIKKCAFCKIEKPVSAFSIDSAKPDGRQTYCKKCRQRRYLRNRDAEIQYSRDRVATEAGRIAKRERGAEWAKRNREKCAAHTAVGWAVSVGKLVKPSHCEKCDNTDIEAHHHMGYDMENRLNVMWLCPTHHAEQHRKEHI